MYKGPTCGKDQEDILLEQQRLVRLHLGKDVKDQIGILWNNSDW